MHVATLTCVSLSGDGQCILVSTLSNCLYLIDKTTGELLNEYVLLYAHCKLLTYCHFFDATHSPAAPIIHCKGWESSTSQLLSSFPPLFISDTAPEVDPELSSRTGHQEYLQCKKPFVSTGSAYSSPQTHSCPCLSSTLQCPFLENISDFGSENDQFLVHCEWYFM